MHQIRPWLFLGKYRETMDLSLLQAHHIGVMLQFEGLVEQPAIETLYLPIADGNPIPEELLSRGINFIQANHRAGKNVFVSCGAGISRSATFVIAALKEIENLSLLEAYRGVLKSHISALPHPALWQSLCTYYQEDTPYWQILKHYNRN